MRCDIPPAAVRGPMRFRAFGLSLIIIAALFSVLHSQRARFRFPSQESSFSLFPEKEVVFQVIRVGKKGDLPPLQLRKRFQEQTANSFLVEETWSDRETGEVKKVELDRRYDLEQMSALKNLTPEALREFCESHSGFTENLLTPYGSKEVCRIEKSETVNEESGVSTIWLGAEVFLGQLKREWVSSDGKSSITYEILSSTNNF
jgi:hypothetical protein